jgi:transcriptional regulator NrdR family protein
MFCPVCGEQTKILQTRLLADGSKKRRRECLDCEVRFTSVEKLFSIPKPKAVRGIKRESEEVGSAPPDLSKLWR